jgi:tRNA(Ile)-lysidine synthase
MVCLEDRVRRFIAKHGLLTNNGLHIVAVSGGADSVALLLILQRLGYRVEAAHCNFNLRGDESKRDEDFVRQLCDNNAIPLHLIHFDTKAYADIHHLSIEMAARELRYRYFEQLRKDIGAENVCVAHHRDDAVETLLMNLLRGTGIHGLTGIRPRNGHVVRPLLDVCREDIVKYLDSIGQPYVTDSTNLVDDVLRNKLRLDVLPLLKTINPKASENIFRTACRMAEAERVFNTAIESAKTNVCPQGTIDAEHAGAIDLAALRCEPSPEYVLFEILSPLGFSPDSIEQIANILEAPTGRYFCSDTHELVFDRDRILVQKRQQQLPSLRIPEVGVYVCGDVKLRVERVEGADVSRRSEVATLDADLLTFPLMLRTVHDGDRFIPFGMAGSRLVSDYLTDLKVSVFDKRRQYVVTDASGSVLWLVGLRTDNRFRVSDTTTATLRLSIEST